MRHTQHGVLMSPRQERLWQFLERVAVPLSDWSTDEDVERCLPSLRKARVVLDRLPEGALSDADLRALKRDVDALTRRVPTNRVRRK